MKNHKALLKLGFVILSLLLLFSISQIVQGMIVHGDLSIDDSTLTGSQGTVYASGARYRITVVLDEEHYYYKGLSVDVDKKTGVLTEETGSPRYNVYDGTFCKQWIWQTPVLAPGTTCTCTLHGWRVRKGGTGGGEWPEFNSTRTSTLASPIVTIYDPVDEKVVAPNEKVIIKVKAVADGNQKIEYAVPIKFDYTDPTPTNTGTGQHFDPSNGISSTDPSGGEGSIDFYVSDTGGDDFIMRAWYEKAPTPASPSTSGRIVVWGVEITEPNNNPVTDNNYTFDSSKKGKCDAGPCTAKVTPESLHKKYAKDIVWSLTPIANSDLKPKKPTGDKVTFTYTVLPASNSEFGNKTLKAEITIDGFNDFDEETVQIFFHRDAYNHTGTGAGTTRNWYYYWKDGSVVSDLSTKNFNYNDNHPNWYGYYLSGNLYVCHLAPTSKNYSVTFTNRYYQTRITSGSDGIADTTAVEDDVQVIPVLNGEPNAIIITSGSNNLLDTDPSGDDGIITGGLQFSIGANGEGVNSCGETCVHELKHKWIYNNWGGQTDSDGDGIPDSQEGVSPYYFNPRKSDTYNLAGAIDSGYASYGDNEFLARKAEQSPGSVISSQDWSDTNGKQWNQ